MYPILSLVEPLSPTFSIRFSLSSSSVFDWLIFDIINTTVLCTAFAFGHQKQMLTTWTSRRCRARHHGQSLGRRSRKTFKSMSHPDSNDHLDGKLYRMNSCVQQSIESCVPAKRRLHDIKSNTSEKTKKLYETRTKNRDTGGQGIVRPAETMSPKNPRCELDRLPWLATTDGHGDGRGR